MNYLVTGFAQCIKTRQNTSFEETVTLPKDALYDDVKRALITKLQDTFCNILIKKVVTV